MTAKTTMVQVHVTRYVMGWQIKVNGRRVSRFAKQSDAEACAIFLARLMPAATVKAHKWNRQVKWERTYPRSRDPKRTPG